MFYKGLFLTMVLIVSLMGCENTDNTGYIKGLEAQIE